MKMMMPDVIGHENQSQYHQHHRCLCLDLSGRLPRRTDFHTAPDLLMWRPLCWWTSDATPPVSHMALMRRKFFVRLISRTRQPNL